MSERERRDFAIAEVRVANSGDTPNIEGYAAVFNSDSVDMGFIERIQRGAFKRSIEGGELIHAFWNHNPDFVLGSTRSGKLALSEDENGLHFTLNASRLTPQQIDAIADGDMRMSFGFSVPKGGDAWEERNGKVLRTLSNVNLFEVSPVASPAYPDTSVALRSLDGWRQDTQPNRAPILAARLRMDLGLRTRTTS